MSADPTYQYQRFGFTFVVYSNRIDISERQLLGTKTSTILARQIASVEIAIGGKLTITLTDATRRTYALGTSAEEAQRAILAILS